MGKNDETLLENKIRNSGFLLEIYDVHQNWEKPKLIGSRIITIEFYNKSCWKFTTALGRKLSDGRLFFTKLFLAVYFIG